MPLHTIKMVSDLVPEAGALVKSASFETNLPTGSKEETLLSALELEYMTKIAHTQVDLYDMERVCHAVDLYDIADEVRAHTGTMVKSASVKASDEKVLQSAVEFIDFQLSSSHPNFEKVAEACEGLWDDYSVTSDSVKLYAGAGTLVKEAAVNALNLRAARTGVEDFIKVAEVIQSTDVSHLTIEDNRAIISAIRGLEKEACYSESNLYTEMFHTKQAAQMVDLGKIKADATDLVRIADRAGDILGADIGLLLKDAHANAAAISALPMGELQAIAGLL